MNVEAASLKDHRPVYIQIAETLRARIVSGYYKDKVDGELPLAREWKVSRRTIQQSLEVLVQEGLLVRQHGMGTFINPKGVERRYRAIASITESIEAQGLHPVFTVLESAEAAASPEEREFFELKPAARVYRHKRLVAADGRPLAIVATSLNLSLLPGLELSRLDRSLYQTLRDQFDRTIVQAEDQYIPALADARTAEMLDIAVSSPVFIALRRARDQRGAPIELSRITMLPVPLDISVRHTGFLLPEGGMLSEPAREWSYNIGFGDFGRRG